MKMVNNPLIYGVAGLLHDIGKFWQRADDLWKESKNLNEHVLTMVEEICPQREDGQPKYQHVIWTYAFLNKHYKKFKNAGIADENMKQSQLINLASFHHKPSTPEQGLITLADICSSGLDRSNEKVQAKNPEWSWDKYKSVPFASPFAVLHTEKNKSFDIVYPAQKLGIGESAYPTKVSKVDNKKLYPNLWNEFESEFINLPDANAEAFIYSLYHLLKKYTTFIPASTQDYPESSLFEHLKTTGAFAHCFAAYKEENHDAFGNGNRIRNISLGHYPVKLFCGDISGIQTFIYNITNKAAAKSLKGRSFYVQLLAESIAIELLNECGCSLINQVYAAGGKFYLLLPNTKHVNSAIDAYRIKLEEAMWEKFGGQLSVNMDGINFSFQLDNERPRILAENESETMDVGLLWRKLSEKTSNQKRRRYSNVFANSFDWIEGTRLFEALGTGGEVEVCAVSGLEISKGKDSKLNKADIEQGNETEPLTIADFVKEQIELGRDLYEHKYLVSLKPESAKGYQAGAYTKWDMLEKGKTANQHYINNWIRTHHEDEIELKPDGFKPHEDNGLGWRLYGGSSMPMKNGKPATFEEIAKLEDEDEGARMGILRMDVDNLGELFMKGFPDEKRSFSALATLSSMLDLYFSGHINYIRNKEKYQNRVNIVYSGGDDVFAVGRWAELIDFAAEVRKGFRKFVGDREDISISGGMVMVGPKFPIAKAANMAGEAEDAAKKYKKPRGLNESKENYLLRKPTKNAINIFGVSICWEHDWDFVVEFKNDLVKWIFTDEIISKGLLMKLFDYYAQYARGEPDWQWNSAYTIARMRSKDDGKKNEVLDTIKILLYCGNYKNQKTNISFDTIIAAARWAELEIKYLKK
jgi:CRISPR-associated protein Csm1